MKSLITVARVENRIYMIRNHPVMIDSDLAELYGVLTKNLNKAVRRNLERFPDDFAFLLTRDEMKNLKFQFGTSSWGGRRKLPYAFTEQGVAMLSSVLNSRRAIQVNIQIMRAFTRIKGFHASYENLKRELQKMRKQYDRNYGIVFDAINNLMDGPTDKFEIKGFKPKRKR